MKRIYLDYNATSPMREGVWQAMQQVFAHEGNPSSLHWWGRHARHALEKARHTIHQSLGEGVGDVFFTSGATEANNWCIHGLAKKTTITFLGSTEHPSLFSLYPYLAKKRKGVLLPVKANGLICQEALEKKLHQAQPPVLVSVAMANGETGVIQPIAELASLVHRYGGFFHTDAVQALGRIPVDWNTLGVDFMTLSSHKIGGPMGIGALIVSKTIAKTQLLSPLFCGGGQEKGLRAGTPSVALAVGFALAFSHATKNLFSQQESLRYAWHRTMENTLETFCPNVRIFSKDAPRLSNTSCIAMPCVPQDVQLMAFDLEGIGVSAGSACSSGTSRASHVLQNMGVEPHVSQTAIRVSSGWQTTQDDMVFFTNVWKSIYRCF